MSEINLQIMKNLFYVTTLLVILIWAIVFFGVSSFRIVDMILLVAGFFLLIGIIFNNELSRKW